ncbi:MAG: hypothetical protein MAG581_00964 [Deltaproteobacteria bacterium]|jgi:quercetin dioxygenase-like cupin family protein|nr:hypothetical protein [Deltaproteobacteria bacterium]
MAKLFKKDLLPGFVSTRDSRDRLDLITENVPVNASGLRADRIIYHKGDSCARHYHKGSHHVFVILEGQGFMYTPESKQLLQAGDTAVIEPEEIHWFENDFEEYFKFIEFWVPPPTETVWIDEKDI